MGVISDAIDSLQDWVENLFRDGVKSQFDSISSLLTDTFDNTTGSGGLVQTFITGHPASFTGNAAGTGTHVWNTIETLCNNVVVPIGGFILTVILLSDLIQTVLRETTSRTSMIPLLSNGSSKHYAVYYLCRMCFTSPLHFSHSAQRYVRTV